MKKIFYIIISSLIIYTSPYCQTNPWWYEVLNTGTTVNLRSVSVANTYPQIVWACGDSGTVIKSNQFPNNFKTVNFGLSQTLTLVNIFALDTSKAWVSGYIGNDTYVFRTVNGGYNWNMSFYQQSGYVNSVFMRNANTGFLSGNPVNGRWSLWKTTNGGVSWDSAGLRLMQSASGEAGFNNSMWVLGDSIWIGTNNYRIYRSLNFGLNWITQTTSLQNTYSLYFEWSGMNPIYGFAGSNLLMRTTNWGMNWVTDTGTSAGTGNIVGMGANPPGVNDAGNIYWFSKENKIYRGYGSNWWSVDYTSPSGSIRHLSQSRTNTNQFWGMLVAVRSNGKINYCYCAFGGINKYPGDIPVKFRLYQNYPNPFNPSTRIRFDITSASDIELKILDAMGRELKTLVNEFALPGTYEVYFTGDDYASGIYFCRLKAGDHINTIKLIIIK